MNPFEENSKENRIFDILPIEYKGMFDKKTSIEIKRELFETALNLDNTISAAVTVALLQLISESLFGQPVEIFDKNSSHTSILILISTTMKLKEIYENNCNKGFS